MHTSNYVLFHGKNSKKFMNKSCIKFIYVFKVRSHELFVHFIRYGIELLNPYLNLSFSSSRLILVILVLSILLVLHLSEINPMKHEFWLQISFRLEIVVMTWRNIARTYLKMWTPQSCSNLILTILSMSGISTCTGNKSNETRILVGYFLYTGNIFCQMKYFLQIFVRYW